MHKLNANAYSAVLKGGLRPTTLIGGTLSRFFISMATLGFLAMYAQEGYSYTLAGIGIGCVQLSNCIISPRVSRLIDTYGQSKVVPPATLVGIGALASVLLIVHFHGPIIAAFAVSVFIGFIPQAQSLTRARWSYLFKSTGTYDATRLRTAFSFEGILDDIAFMFSPALAIALSSWLFPEAGLVLGGIAYVIGITLVLIDKKSEPDVTFMNRRAQKSNLQDDTLSLHERKRSVLIEYPVVAVFFVSMLMFGLLFGFLDPSTYGFCGEVATEEVASLAFMVSSVFSVVTGFVFGMLYVKSPPVRQAMIVGLVVAVLYVPFLLVGDIPTLFLAHIAGAFSYAPFVITVNSIVERSVPSSRVTESLTWMGSGIQLGLAFGPGLAGLVIDAYSVQAAFAGVSLSAALIPVLFVVTLPILRKGLPSGA